MRTSSVLVWLVVACGPAARPPSVVDNTVPPAPARPDPHASRDNLVNEAFAQLSSGNVDGFVALAPKAADMEGALTCDDTSKMQDIMSMVVQQSQDKLRKAAERSKAQYQVVAIDTRKAKSEGKAGDREQDCTLKVDVTTHKLEVKLKLQKDATRTARMEVLQLGSRFYLSTMSKLRAPDDAVVDKFRAHTERVCACPDIACVTEQSTVYARDMEAWAKEHAGEAEPPDVESSKAIEEITKRMTECVSKLAASATSP